MIRGKLSLPVVALYQRERAIASHHEAVRHKPKQKAGMTFSEVLDAVLIGLLRYLWGPTSLRKHLPKLEGAAMKPTDAERFEKLAEAYRPNADYCRHMAAGAGKHSSKEHWVRLAMSWIKLAKAEKANAESRWTELASQ